MASSTRTPDVYGPGTWTDTSFTPVPKDTERIFRQLCAQTPGFTQDEALLSKVTFTGEDFPVIPGPIKATSVAAALHAMCGVLGDEILTLRGNEDKKRKITVNTTHTALWFGCVATAYLDGQDVLTLSKQGKLKDILPDWEQGWTDTPLKYRTTGLYPTKDPQTWYSLHGSMNALPVLKSIGIDPNTPTSSNSAAASLIAQHTQTYSPAELEFQNITHGFCGSICFTPQQWSTSSMGKALASRPLIDITPQPHAVPTPPISFPPFDPADPRPLTGTTVLELTRVIAGPQIGAILASLGATVLRLNAPHLPDLNLLQLTLNTGKRTSTLDLRSEPDRLHLQTLLSQTDIFIQGFRPGKIAAFGFGLNDLLSMAGKRGKGIVYVSENCYGKEGCYAPRPGWQQIADAAAGSAYVTGRSLDLPNGECVLPSLPVSDMTTGVLGAVGAMMALRERAVKGGSWAVDAALVGVNAYALREDVGLYGKETVQECRERFAWGEMRGEHHVLDLLATVWGGWKRVLGGYLEEGSGWFQGYEGSAFGGKKLSVLKPVVQIRGGDGVDCVGWRTPSVPYGMEELEGLKW